MIVRIERKEIPQYNRKPCVYWRIVRYDTQKHAWEFIGAEASLIEAQLYAKKQGIDLKQVDIVR